MIGRFVARGVIGVASVPVRRFGRSSFKGKLIAVAILAVFMSVGMIAAHSNSAQGARVQQQQYELEQKKIDHLAHETWKVPANCQTTTTTSTSSTGKHSVAVKKVCK